MKVSTVKSLCTLLACGLLAACSQWRYDLGAPLADTPIPAERTTLADTLALLGPPLLMTATDNGFVLAWEHWHIREDSVGFRLGALGADFMSADWGEMRIKGEFLLLTFDKQHLLTSSSRSEWDNYGGGGKAIQPLFGFVSVVDVDDLTDVMPQHRWGRSLLQRLPGVLNTSSNLDTGQSGLQQRGTPTAAGQQSLEMD
ncbi:Uncharacterised protein [Halioglobus japonicus]|nr:Uncharacterised protein [Halioglobus japonicus]